MNAAELGDFIVEEVRRFVTEREQRMAEGWRAELESRLKELPAPMPPERGEKGDPGEPGPPGESVKGEKGDPGDPGEIPIEWEGRLAGVEQRLADWPTAQAEVSAQDAADVIAALLREELGPVLQAAAPVRTQKRVIRDAKGKIESVVEEVVT